MSTVDASTEPPCMVPRPPVPGVPMDGVAVSSLSWKLLPPVATSVLGLRIEASATWPTVACVPSEYCATINPPLATPTFTSSAAAVPFCELADEADGCPNCVILPDPSLLYGFQEMAWPEAAPSARSGSVNVIGGPSAGGGFPFASKVIGVAGTIVDAVGSVRSDPGIDTEEFPS